MEALVRYIHAAAGFPIWSTWLKAIKNGNFNSWPGLTYNNAEKILPTINGNNKMAHGRIFSRSQIHKKDEHKST